MISTKKKRVRQAFSNLLGLVRDLREYIGNPTTKYPISLDSATVQALGLTAPSNAKTVLFTLDSAHTSLEVLLSCMTFSQKILKHASSSVEDLISMELAPLQLSLLEILLSCPTHLANFRDADCLLTSTLQVWSQCLHDRHGSRSCVKTLLKSDISCTSVVIRSLLIHSIRLRNTEFGDALAKFIQFARIHCPFLSTALFPVCGDDMTKAILELRGSLLSVELNQLYLTFLGTPLFPITPARWTFILNLVLANNTMTPYWSAIQNWVMLANDFIFIAQNGQIVSKQMFSDEIIHPSIKEQCRDYQKSSFFRKFCLMHICVHLGLFDTAAQFVKSCLDVVDESALSAFRSSSLFVTNVTYLILNANHLIMTNTHFEKLLMDGYCLTILFPCVLAYLIKSETILSYLPRIAYRIIELQSNKLVLAWSFSIDVFSGQSDSNIIHYNAFYHKHRDLLARILNHSDQCNLDYSSEIRAVNSSPMQMTISNEDMSLLKNETISLLMSLSLGDRVFAGDRKLFYDGLDRLHAQICPRHDCFFSNMNPPISNIPFGPSSTYKTVSEATSALSFYWSLCHFQQQNNTINSQRLREETKMLVRSFITDSINGEPLERHKNLIDIYDFLDRLLLNAKGENVLFFLLLYFELMSFTMITDDTNIETSPPVPSSSSPPLQSDVLSSNNHRSHLQDGNIASHEIPSKLSLAMGYQRLIGIAKKRYPMMEAKQGFMQLLMPWQNEITYHVLMLRSGLPTYILLKELAYYLNASSVHKLVRKSFIYVLPRCVEKKDTQTLSLMAHIVGNDVSSLLVEHLHDIFSFIFVELEPASLGNTMLTLQSLVLSRPDGEKESDETMSLTVKDLIKSCAMSLVNKLSNELGNANEQKKQKALRAISYVASVVQNDNISSQTINQSISSNALMSSKAKESLSTFIKHHFLGILHHINETLLGKNDNTASSVAKDDGGHSIYLSQEIASKEKAARAFIEIIKLMGNHVYAVHAQITATLQVMMSDPKLALVTLRAWDGFIKGLEVTKIGPLLSTIIASLLKLLHLTDPEESQDTTTMTKLPSEPSIMKSDIIHLMEFLIIDQRHVLRKHFDELFFLPETPTFSRLRHVINDVIATNMSNMQQVISEESIRRHMLAHLTKALNHENDLVIFYALLKLRQLLQECQAWFHQLILGEQVDSLVADLLRSLLYNTRHFNNDAKHDVLQEDTTAHASSFNILETQLLVTECLGLLGAIDPGRLDVHEVQRSITCIAEVVSRTSSVEFACLLIADHLVPILRAANDTKTQNKAAYAIQELLKLCEFPEDLSTMTTLSAPISDKTKRSANNTNGNTTYTPPMMSEITIFTSPFPYKFRGNARETWMAFPKHVHEAIQPLLQARYTMSYADTTPKISGTIYESSNCYHDWLFGWTKDLMAGISDEFLGPIVQACRGIVRSHSALAVFFLPYLVLHAIMKGKNTESIYDECMAVLMMRSNLSVTGHKDMEQLCTQTVFTLLDQISFWVLQQKRVISAKSKETGTTALTTSNAMMNSLQATIAALDEFLRRIPHRLLADASYRCRAYARALRHMEQYIRADNIVGIHHVTMHENEKRETATLPSGYSSHLEHMQKIYAQLDEPDGLDGIARLLLSPSLDTQILEHEAFGRWTAAQTCYELALQRHPDDMRYHVGLMRCLKHLGHLETLGIHTRGISKVLEKSTQPWIVEDVRILGVEAAWRLSDWQTLSELVKSDTRKKKDDITLSDANLLLNHTLPMVTTATAINQTIKTLPLSLEPFEVLLGRILLAWHESDDEGFRECIKSTRVMLLAPLAAASMESYRRTYPLVVQLHMLAETEAIHEHAKEVSPKSLSWDSRLRVTQSSFRVRECILNLRRVLLLLKEKDISVSLGKAGSAELSPHMPHVNIQSTPLSDLLSEVYLQAAKAARHEGHFSSAYNAILHAEALGCATAGLERSRWCWDRGEREKALVELQKVYDVQAKNLQASPVPESGDNSGHEIDINSPKFLHAKTTLLLGRWLEDTGHSKSTDVLAKYLEVISLQKRWAKGYYYLGRYQNKLFENEIGMKNGGGLSPLSSNVNVAANGITSAHLTYVAHTVRNFARSLLCSSKYLYQTLPKLLTLWLDYGAMVSLMVETHAGNLTREQETLRSMEGVIDTLTHRATALMFLTAFPQIVSRICHRNDRVFDRLEAIMIKVLKAYPQQALWQMMAVSKSTFPMRSRRCNDIFAKIKSTVPELRELVVEATALTDQLLILCNYPTPPDVMTLSIGQEFRALQRMTPLQVMMPLQCALIPALPMNGGSSFVAGDWDCEPFSKSLVTIHAFKDEVEIINSLQRPRKISMIGSDGQTYTFLCKPKDDLRKDARMMEFNSLINKLLKQDPETRKRSLYIRTYAVVPVNEECGIIEWVPHTAGFRHILLELYNSRNMNVSMKEIKMLIRQKKSLKSILLEDLIPRFPPVFHNWFLETFPEPTTWFGSRLAYARTSAVISIIGFILGLGDRHGENILFDDRTGDCVHVDFNCLFDKGLTFEKPEKVPFRLTHNMVDALGVTGYEGVFRKSCEVTLRLLRAHRDSLVSVLEAFVHDPLVEWSKGRQLSKTGEMENEKGLKCLHAIDKKITGILKSPMPLSVEGQVQELIFQATSDENLSEMYIGWAAYM